MIGPFAAPPPPSCADVPVAPADPGGQGPGIPAIPLWSVPPGGRCVADPAPPPETRLRLEYPDGHLWARWRFAPLVNEQTFVFPDGRRTVIIVDIAAPRADATLIAGGRRRTLRAFPGEVSRSAGCTAEMPRIARVPAGRAFRVVLPGVPRALRLHDPEGRLRLTRTGPRRARLAPSPAGPGATRTVVLEAAGAWFTYGYPVCVAAG